MSEKRDKTKELFGLILLFLSVGFVSLESLFRLLGD